MYYDYHQNNQIKLSFYQFNVKTLSKYLIFHWEISTYYKGSVIINRIKLLKIPVRQHIQYWMSNESSVLRSIMSLKTYFVARKPHWQCFWDSMQLKLLLQFYSVKNLLGKFYEITIYFEVEKCTKLEWREAKSDVVTKKQSQAGLSQWHSFNWENSIKR